MTPITLNEFGLDARIESREYKCVDFHYGVVAEAQLNRYVEDAWRVIAASIQLPQLSGSDAHYYFVLERIVYK